MRKTLIFALTFLPAAALAQCPAFSPVDVFLNFNGAAPGTTVTTSNLQASTEGTGGTWSTANSLMSLQASQVPLPASVSVNGGASHGCGYATQSMAIIENTPGPGHTSQLTFNNGKTQVVTSGWIVNLPPNQGGAGDLFDYIVYESATNAGSGVTQVQPGTGLSCPTGTPPFMEMESYDSSTTHSLPCIPVPASGTVYFSHLMNYGTSGNCNGTASGNVAAPCEGIYVYTTSGTTFTQIGSAAIALHGADSQGLMLFGNNENASFIGTSYFQNIMIDWTNHVWPNLPTGGSTCLWCGILKPVDSTFGTASVANNFGIQWQNNVGLPGGAWAKSNSAIQCGSTIASGSSAATIQTALTACGGTSAQQKYVQLAAGTYSLTTTPTVPSYTELRCASPNACILQLASGSRSICEPYTSGDTGGVCLGTYQELTNTPVSITGGATAGSTSITVSSAAGMAVGGLLAITETNASWVSANGDEGNCSWCDGGLTSNGNRARGQTVEIAGISGTTVTLSPPGLFSPYTNTPQAIYFVPTRYAGLRDVQLYAEGVGVGSNVVFDACAYCYTIGVVHNYYDGNSVTTADSYRDEIRDGYFSGTFTSGGTSFDGDLDLTMRTSQTLVENNIIERGINAIMLEWGSAGNVIGYNYGISGYSAGGYNSTYGGVNFHGAWPQFNLIEGNTFPTVKLDGVWGGSSMNVTHRNWLQQTTKVCTPYTTSGRATVTTPCFQTPYQMVGSQYDHLSVYGNSVSDVIGSAQSSAVGQTAAASVHWISGTANRNMFNSPPGGNTWPFTWGYGADSDDGSGTGCASGGIPPCQSTAPYNTSFVYNTYSAAPVATLCILAGASSSCPTADVPSYYLAAKPAFWGSLPWPGNGVDVTGGTGPGGHANLNPAASCFLNVMGGTDGSVGSPYAFNENTCYYATPGPGAPTNLTGTVSVTGSAKIQ